VKLARWLVPLATLLLLGIVTAWEFEQRTSPGPLHPAHAAQAELAGGPGCRRCHGTTGDAVAAEACGACHGAVQAQLGSGRGLHGALPAAQAAACAGCHGEHHGEQTRLLDGHSFARAGVADAAAYGHEHVPGYELAGRHRALACAECHPHADAAVPPGARCLGLRQECATCHEDPHRGSFGGDCEGCHGQEERFRAAPGFRHEALPLRGAHVAILCAACHAEGTPHAVAALRDHPQPARACGACHADPHGEAPARGVRAALRLADTAHCARCHTATRWADARVEPAAHAPGRFPLRGEHAEVACAACHGDATRPPAFAGAPPALASCAACHAHPHQQELVAAAVAVAGPPDGCAECHRDDDPSFGAGTLRAAQHAATGFPLQTPHAEVACSQCHAGATWGDRFPGRTAAACRACHQDPHAGQFAHAERFAQCTACHAPTRFVPPTFDVAAHAQTAFPLTGAHAAVGCALCHRDVRAGTRIFRGTRPACADCHADVHRGAFDRADLPGTVAGRAGCARCHDTTAFTPVSSRTFDHGLWTGHVLEGAHAALDCRRCHAANEEPAGTLGRRLGATRGRACADCHADPHLGQFAASGRTDCARCHTAAVFAPARFDHQRDSAFPLDETHRRLECARCHHPVTRGDRTMVRYKPLGTRCGDCHVLERGQVRR
jgi:hypothetical protein